MTNRKMKAGLALTALCVVGLVAPGAAFAADKPITLTGFFADPNPKWSDNQDEVGKVITAKTGVTLKAEYAVGDPDQKVQLIAASGQYPDLIAPKGSSGVLVDAGAMVELSSLINKYAPNIKKVVGNQMDRLRFSSKDPGIYFIPNNEGFGQINYDNHGSFKLQLGALKEQGYPKIATLTDYEKVIAAYVKAHPATDGQPTIGLSLLADDWRFVISVSNPAFQAAGFADDGEWAIDEKTYAAKPHYFRPDEKEYFRWLNHMNDIGLLDQESFVQKWDQYKSKIATGRIVGLIDADWEIGDGINSLKAAGKFDQTYGHFSPVVKVGLKSAINRPTGFKGGYGIGITKSCKDPVRAIKYLDFLASEEAQVLNNWGIKDKHYTVVNGKRQIIPSVNERKINDNNAFTKTTGIGNYFISARYGDGVKDSTGNYVTTNFPEQILTSYSDAEKAALKAYKVTYWGDIMPPAKDFTPIPWAAAWSIPVPQDSALSEFWNVEQDIVKKYIPQAILAKPADFDKIYGEFLTKLDANTSKYQALETGLVKDRLKLWKIAK